MSAVAVPVVEPQIGPAERDAVDRVLRGGYLSQGAEVGAFETEFSTFVGGRPCVAVSSGTSALQLGLLAAGVGPGDEVIVPSFTAVATANAVALTGATLVFADIEPTTYCLDPRAVEAAVTPRTVGVVPVHLFGQPADMTAFEQLAQTYGLGLFGDACQAHGARMHGRSVASFGTLAAFSFHPTKNMTTGEGGMVVCADDGIADRVRVLRNQGMAKRIADEVVGFNARMTDVAAAIGRVQLDRLPGFNRVRRMNASLLDDGLRAVSTPVVRSHCRHVFQQYAVRSVLRDRIGAELASRGLGSAVSYPTPVHRLPAYSVEVDLPETDRAASELLSLPVHPGVEADDVQRVVRAVNDVTTAGRIAS